MQEFTSLSTPLIHESDLCAANRLITGGNVLKKPLGEGFPLLHGGLFHTPGILRTVKCLIDIRGASLDMEDQITR